MQASRYGAGRGRTALSSAGPATAVAPARVALRSRLRCYVTDTDLAHEAWTVRSVRG